jgi:D-alanyl-D-alanine dipeptidase
VPGYNKKRILTAAVVLCFVLLAGCSCSKPDGEQNDNRDGIAPSPPGTSSEIENTPGSDIEIIIEDPDTDQQDNNESPQDQEQNKPEEIADREGLVNVLDIDPSFVVELRYATDNNFAGKKLYPAAVCLLRRETAEKLKNANQDLQTYGYTIKIWDAYRPYHFQQILWDAAENKMYLANPKNGSRHNRGAAVDITLVDSYGNEAEMPTDFDEFSERASRWYPGMTENARNNLDLLTKVMEKHGFIYINMEWWHYEDSNWRDYPILDIPLEVPKDTGD